MPSLWKTLAVLGMLLSLFPFYAEGKAIEGKIVVPIPFVSNQLFDNDIKNKYDTPSPDSNPCVEAINQGARKKYHFDHPTWKEFFSFK